MQIAARLADQTTADASTLVAAIRRLRVRAARRLGLDLLLDRRRCAHQRLRLPELLRDTKPGEPPPQPAASSVTVVVAPHHPTSRPRIRSARRTTSGMASMSKEFLTVWAIAAALACRPRDGWSMRSTPWPRPFRPPKATGTRATASSARARYRTSRGDARRHRRRPTCVRSILRSADSV
jgi:hypothetical protein